MEPTETGLSLPHEQFADALDTLTTCAAVFQNMIDYSTINYKQSQELLQAARKRINHFLGGAHSTSYKKYVRCYMINLWNGLKENFHCGSSYKDLNPVDFNKALDYINEWEYEQD